MKLAFISPFQFRMKRGIERFVWSLASEFVSLGNEVHLLTWKAPNPADWGAAPENLHIHRVPYTRYFAQYFAVPFYIYWLTSQKFDQTILAFAGYGERESLTLANYFSPQKYTIVFHFPVEQVPHRYEEFRRDSLAQRASLRIAVSQYVANGVERTFNCPCTVIANGVDPIMFRPSPERRQSARKQLGLKLDTPMLITLAALEERKGIQWVVRALPALLNDFPNLEYWVLGEGDYRAQLEAEIQSLGLEDHVRLLGNVNDVVTYLASADVGCLLSYGESFGLAVLEYMAMQLPVLCSKHPPFSEIVHAKWSITVNEQATQDVVTAIKFLLSDQERRQQMGKTAREEVLLHYTWSQVASVYQELLEKSVALRQETVLLK